MMVKAWGNVDVKWVKVFLEVGGTERNADFCHFSKSLFI